MFQRATPFFGIAHTPTDGASLRDLLDVVFGVIVVG